MPPVAPPCPPMPLVELPCPVNIEMCIACMYTADLQKDNLVYMTKVLGQINLESKTTKSFYIFFF